MSDKSMHNSGETGRFHPSSVIHLPHSKSGTDRTQIYYGRTGISHENSASWQVNGILRDFAMQSSGGLDLTGTSHHPLNEREIMEIWLSLYELINELSIIQGFINDGRLTNLLEVTPRAVAAYNFPNTNAILDLLRFIDNVRSLVACGLES